MTTADNIASLGLLAGFVHTAAIGLLDIVSGGGGGAGKRPRKLVKPVWYDPGPLIEPRRAPREEAEALLFCDAL